MTRSGHTGSRRALSTGNARVLAVRCARARWASWTSSRVAVAAPDEASVIVAREVSRFQLHVPHSVAQHALAALVTFSRKAQPCSFTATAVALVICALHVQPACLAQYHGGQQVQVVPAGVQYLATSSTGRLAGQVLESTNITQSTGRAVDSERSTSARRADRAPNNGSYEPKRTHFTRRLASSFVGHNKLTHVQKRSTLTRHRFILHIR